MTEPTSATATVTRSVEVASPPDAVYATITDLDALAELADEAVAMRWKSGSAATPGAVFVGSNRNGRRSWKTTCTVTEAVPGRTFEFEVTVAFPKAPVARWRYDLEPAAVGCRVTESTWDLRPGWFRGVGSAVTGIRDRDAANAHHIEATLQRLRSRFEG